MKVTTMRKIIAAAGAALFSFTLATAAGAATLAPAPVAAETFDVGMLHVERYGDRGPAVVLIPGLASGAWTWYGVIPHLAASHSVYSVTLAGFAGRPAPAGDVSIARFDADLSTLLSTRAVVRPVLVGHSLGGTLAIAYAEAHPDRIASVVAVDGLPVFPTMAQMSGAARTAAAAQITASVRNQTDEQFTAYERQYMASIGVTDAALATQVGTLSAQSDRAVVASWLQADLAADLRPQLAAITVPLTEITGWSSGEPYSEADKAAFYRMLLTGAPKANVVTIAGAKHFLMLDQPEAFSAALDRALAAR
jgi:pimeloyl-ACP methyl ester carboxylesterase